MIQLQVLNKILSTQDTSVLLTNNLTEDFFSDYTQEYRWLKQHLDEYGNCPDIHSFVDKFPEFDIIQVNETNRYLIDELYQDYNKRKLASVFNRVRDLINQDKIDEAMSVYTNASSDIVQSTHLDSVDIFHDTSRYNDYIDKCTSLDKYYIKNFLSQVKNTHNKIRRFSKKPETELKRRDCLRSAAGVPFR